VIYVNTFSHSLAPSMRMGYMVLPERLMEQYRQTLGFYSWLYRCSSGTFWPALSRRAILSAT